MKPLVQITPLAVSGCQRTEVSLFMAWASAWQAAAQNQDKILDLYLVPEKRVPATCARNHAVQLARQRGVDVLFMLDDDMSVTPQFFEAALEFLIAHPGPAAIGVPYCTAPPLEDVTVFELTTAETGAPEERIKMQRVGRQDAARRKKIERVVNMGTGCIAYDLRIFSKLPRPWFEYGYDEDHTAVIETEDCWCHRHMAMLDLPLYCHWDFWAGHWKSKLVGKPGAIEQKMIDRIYVREAEANLRHLPQAKGIEKVETAPCRVQVHAGDNGR